MESDEPPVPHIIALLWGRAEPARRGPRPTLTIGDIGRAAIALADAEGLDAVSMKRVAEACGVSTMALYRYVESKAELHVLMLEFAGGEPPAVSRRRRLRTGLAAWCRAYRDVQVEHPWMLEIPAETPSADAQPARLDGGSAADHGRCRDDPRRNACTCSRCSAPTCGAAP